MIRCIRLWTGEDQNSHFQEGWIDLGSGVRGDLMSGTIPVTSVSFQETVPGGTFAWRATKPGEYPYGCSMHPRMRGVISVQ